MKRGRAVNTQMPQTKVPGTMGAKGSIHQYPDSPFSTFTHDTGNGGIPTKIMESHGERLPKDAPPAQTAPPRGKGMPSAGKRRWG